MDDHDQDRPDSEERTQDRKKKGGPIVESGELASVERGRDLPLSSVAISDKYQAHGSESDTNHLIRPGHPTRQGRHQLSGADTDREGC